MSDPGGTSDGVSVLPAQASFEELIQDCFLALSGRGLMLSPLDAQLLGQWAQARVPAEVVIAGLQRAHARLLYDARPGDAVRSLRSCRREVDAEIRRHRERSAGAGSADAPLPTDAPSRKLTRALRALAHRRPDLAPAVEKLCTGLWRVPFERRDAVALYALFRDLPRAERRAVWEDALRGAQEEPASWHARKVSRRFHRLLSIRRALQLPAVW